MSEVLFDADIESLVTAASEVRGTPQSVALTGGGHVVVWDTFGVDDPFGQGVFAQLYDASGAKVGAAFQVNTIVDLDQTSPHVAALADGGFVVSYATAFDREFTDDPLTLHTQRFDANGARVGAETAFAPDNLSNYGGAAVAALADGGHVVAYTALDANLQGVYLQRFNAAGAVVGGPTLVNSAQTGGQGGPGLTALTDGGLLVSWVSNGQDGSGSGVYLQRYDAAGAKVGSEVRANSTTAGHQGDQAVSALASGGYVVSWTSEGQDGSFSGVYAQVFSAAGAKVGGETCVNAFTAGSQNDPSVSGLPGGGYVVAWTSDNQDGTGVNIYAREFDASGAAVTGEVLVNTVAPGLQIRPHVESLPDGDVVITWLTIDGVFQRRFDGDGEAPPPPPPPSPPPTTQTLTAGEDVVVAASTDQLVLTAPSHFDPRDNISGGGGVDTLQLIQAGVLDLTAPVTFRGFEYLVGSAGDDAVLTSAGRLLGITQIDGGAGFDRLQLKSAGTLDVRGIDLTSIEVVAGSAGKDQLIGNGAANTLSGGGGGDRLTGGGGADTFVYDAPSDSGASARDQVLDFSRAQGDRIDLRAIDAVAGGADNAFILASRFSGVAGQLVVSTLKGGGFLVQGDVNGDRNADFAIEVTTPTSLTSGDFLL